MARFIDETGRQWAEGRIRGLDFAEGVYGKVCAVERDGLTLMAKGFKRFEGERGSSGAEMRRDREYDRLASLDGLRGYAPRVRCKGVLEVNGESHPAFLMTYVEGVSFDRALDVLAGSDIASLSASETLELAGKLVEPFLAMERAGVAHGDLHADNVRIVVEAVGRPSVARVGLIDFGNARQSDAAGRSLYTPTPTVKRKMPGSFWFESPESFSCDACPHNEGARSKPSSNMWAFGALLYYAYYRHLPHDGAARAYSSVWGSETVSEKGRASALRAFIEAKAAPLELPMSPGDNEDSFQALSDLIRNTMVDDPSRRWTAQLCKRRVKEFSESRAAESCDSPRPRQFFSAQGGRCGAGGQGAVSKRTLPDDPGSGSGRQADGKKASKAGSLVRAGFVWAFAHFGIPRCQAALGSRYRRGDGFAQNGAKAVAWCSKAAERGNAAAQSELGFLYEKGIGVACDYAKAAELYAQAAERGCVEALRNLGRLHYRGLGVVRSDRLAAELWSDAAERGDAAAQCCLGYLYDKGRGVARNRVKAVEWYAKAADQGHAAAQCNLAYLLYNGLGAERDVAEATRLWRRAAAHGHEDALAALAKHGLA